MKYFPNASNIWDLKLVCAQVLNEPTGKSLVSQEFAQSVAQQVRVIMDSWQLEIKENLQRFVQGKKLTKNPNLQTKLSKFVTHYNIPYNLELSKASNPLDLLFKINKHNVPSYTAYKLIEIMS